MFSKTFIVAFLALVSIYLINPVFCTAIPTSESAVVSTPVTNAGGSYSNGRGTWFYPGLGACGGHNTSNDRIVALSKAIWNRGGRCGDMIKITNAKNGKTVTVKVVDECPECSAASLDLSPAAFKKLASLSEGQIKINWHFL